MTKPGIIYFKFIYSDGNFIVYPIKRKIDIIDFKEKIYFFNYTLETKNNEIIFIYNVTNLTEDRLVYFACIHKQFEICDISSQKCEFVNTFYKFLANKEYFINAYSYDEYYYHYRRTIQPYIFGVFNKENIKLFNDLGVDKNNEPNIYLVNKKYVSSFYFININTYLSFYAEEDYEIDEIFDNLPNIYFGLTISEYKEFNLRDHNYKILLVIPNFNYKLESYDNYVIGCSNKLFINEGSNEEIKISSGENAIIKIKEEDYYFEELKDYYNTLRIIKSQYNNIAFINSDNGYNKLSDYLISNSIEKHSNYIYIDKLEYNNTVQFFYYEPRYSYYYALDDESLKNRTNFMKKNGFNSYFKRKNSELGNFHDIFNKMTFDLEDNIYIYFKKYYGNSNIYEINLESYNINDLSFLTKPIKTYENENSILNKLLNL